MLRPRPSLASVAACLVAVGLVVGACGGMTSAAFEVNGAQTSQRDFDRELDALVDNEEFVEIYEDLGGPVRSSEGTVSAQLAAEWATLVIQLELVGGAVADEGIEVTEEDRAEARNEAATLFGADEAGEQVFAAFPEWFQDRILDRISDQVAYVRVFDAPPSDDEIQEFYDTNVSLLVDQCPTGKFASHILVASEEEASAILAEIDAGADFGELAAERSTDPGSAASAGFLDCFQEGAYVPQFETAVAETPAGGITGPVESEFGWHLIRVDAQPPLEGVRGQIEAAIGGRAQQEAFQTLLDEAEVDVDPRYGTWVVDERGARVEPPEPAVGETDPTPEAPELQVPELDEPPPAP